MSSETPRTDAANETPGYGRFEMRKLARELERELTALHSLVRAFCEGQRWAVQSWKDQPHIKPLFDLANIPTQEP